MTHEIRFTDGAAYDRYMGAWSRLAGHEFLDWLAPAAGLRWLDVGCGGGAFTDLIVERCTPASVHGIDPAEAQLAYARTQSSLRAAHFHVGDAQAIPFDRHTFDIAVMPLVIFFVPDPARGVAEMARVVSPGGSVAAYAWDMEGGGFPYATVQGAMRDLGLATPQAPSRDASRLDRLQELWAGAGLEAVKTHRITVHRTFPDFDDYWTTIQGAPSVGPTLAAASSGELARLATLLRERLPPDAAGRITYGATSNAITGRVQT